MEKLIERTASVLPGALSGLSGYYEQLTQYLNQHLSAIPLPVIHLVCLLFAGVLVYALAKILFRIALFVVAPTVCTSLAVAYAVPALESSWVIAISAVFFVALYILKH